MSRIEEDAETASTLVRSKFLLVEIPPQRAAALWRHLLPPLTDADGDIRIAWKRVDLVNCDAPMDGIVVPF